MLAEAPHQEKDGVDEEQQAPPARQGLPALLPMRSLREMFALVKQGGICLVENHHFGARHGQLSAPWSSLEQRDFLDELLRQSVA